MVLVVVVVEVPLIHAVLACAKIPIPQGNHVVRQLTFSVVTTTASQGIWYNAKRLYCRPLSVSFLILFPDVQRLQ